MSEFTPINSQEELDQVIKSRLERERSTVSKQYEEKLADYGEIKKSLKQLTEEKASWESSANETAEKIKTLEGQLTEANTRVRSYELDSIRTSAALANGIPFELRNRIAGDTEEAIQADAKQLAEIFNAQNSRNIPQFDPNGGVSDDFATTGKVNEERAKRKFAESLKKLQ